MITPRRTVAGPLAALVVSLACGPSERSDGPTREPIDALLASAASDYQVRAGLRQPEHTLVVATRELPRSLDPHGELDPWGLRLAEDLVFQGLTRRTEGPFPFAEPELSDRCVAVPEVATRTVACRVPRDREFHDGSPVTADDVLYSVQAWLDPRLAALRAHHGLAELERVELGDAPAESGGGEPGRWVRLGFARPVDLALERISAIKIVPRAAHRGRARAFGQAPIGSGPMRVVAMDGDRIELEKVAAPTGADDEVLRVVLRSVHDGAQALTMVRRGEAHLLDAVAAVHVPDELTRPGMAARFAAYVRTPPSFDLLVYNLRPGVLANAVMRDAIDHAIPLRAIDALYGMPSAPALAPVDLWSPQPLDLAALEAAGPSATWGMAGLPALSTQDDEASTREAARLLDALGWLEERGVRRRPSGPLRAVLLWDGERGRGAAVATTLREAWRALGVQVPHATASWAYVFTLLRRGEFDFALLRLNTRSFQDLRPFFHSRGELNLSGISDGPLDEALEAYARARDSSERRKAQETIAERLAALRPATMLHAPTEIMLASKRLEGLAFVDDLPRLDRIRLAADSPWIEGPAGRTR